MTKASVLDSLNVFEEKKRHVHRVFWTDREGESADQGVINQRNSQLLFKITDLLIYILCVFDHNIYIFLLMLESFVFSKNLIMRTIL